MREKAAALAFLLDEVLDAVPACEGGRWYRYGDWGCRLRLHRYWDHLAGTR